MVFCCGVDGSNNVELLWQEKMSAGDGIKQYKACCIVAVLLLMLMTVANNEQTHIYRKSRQSAAVLLQIQDTSLKLSFTVQKISYEPHLFV